MSVVVAAIGDLHCGSTVGLLPPGPIPMDDGGVYHQSKAQKWSWDHFLSFVNDVKRARKKGDKLCWVLNGDLVDGDHHDTTQIVSRDLAIQSLILQLCAQPIIDTKPDQVIIIRGTPSHVGKAGGAEEGFGKWLAAKVPVAKIDGRCSHFHFTGTLGNVRFDLSHHGKVGSRSWTKGNAVNALALETYIQYTLRGETPPQIVLRSHCHIAHDSGPATPLRLIALPAWQFKTEYGHKMFPESLADVGGAIIRCEDGKFEVDTKLYYPKRDALWRPVL